MKHTTTLITLLVAAVLVVALFKVKYQVIDLEGELAKINQDIIQDTQEIHVLKAEWSYLNDPNRLRQLVEKYLTLEPIKPQQISSFDGIPQMPSEIPSEDADPLHRGALVTPLAKESTP